MLQPRDDSTGPGTPGPNVAPARLSGEAPVPACLAADSKIESALERLDGAVHALRRRRPDLSAGEPIWLWQRITISAAIAVLAGALVLTTGEALFALALMLGVPFFCVVALRTIALWHTTLGGDRSAAASETLCSPTLPSYSILVPLYDEADVIPDLVAAMGAIDYPADRLEIILILEHADRKTPAAMDAIALPAHMSVVVVPEGCPRTKPRALNYALSRAAGDLVVVYDAEDLPEPDQLRRAAAALAGNPRLGCVQARLNVLNDSETWLTRQFAIEYTALFDCLLPTLDRLNLPLPLGGTSNHFPRAVLEAVGGWDPFNVTEDADLGIRLARARWRVAVLPSTTWEEAPPNFHAWLNQRTRWLKGWMQTYLVHMRRPLATARDLGLGRFLGLQVLMGGILLSALVHPWFYVLALAEAAFGPLITLEADPLTTAVIWMSVSNLVLGYVSGVALGAVAVAGRGRLGLLVSALWMPVYWLLISAAAYRALLQLATAPHLWEKTAHRPRAAYESGSLGLPLKTKMPPAASGRRISGQSA